MSATSTTIWTSDDGKRFTTETDANDHYNALRVAMRNWVYDNCSSWVDSMDCANVADTIIGDWDAISVIMNSDHS